jgi:hypothetical protein
VNIEGLARPPHSPEHAAEESPVPLPTPPRIFILLLKAVLNVVVADERALDGQEDLSGETTA